MIRANKILRRRIKMLTKRYPILAGWSKSKKETDSRKKTREIENKIPRITGVVTTGVLNTITESENKITDITVFITTLEFNRSTKKVFMQKRKKQRKALQVKVK